MGTKHYTRQIEAAVDDLKLDKKQVKKMLKKFTPPSKYSIAINHCIVSLDIKLQEAKNTLNFYDKQLYLLDILDLIKVTLNLSSETLVDDYERESIELRELLVTVSGRLKKLETLHLLARVKV